MAKNWIDRLRGRMGRRRGVGRRRPVSWLGRIDGVEKPALLVGFGMLLYRAWKLGEPGAKPGSRWRGALRSLRGRIERSLGRGSSTPPLGSAQQEVPDGATGATQRGQRQHQSRPGHPPA